MENALTEQQAAHERRLKHEFSTRVTQEVQRIEREKVDRADAKLRLENERLRK